MSLFLETFKWLNCVILDSVAGIVACKRFLETSKCLRSTREPRLDVNPPVKALSEANQPTNSVKSNCLQTFLKVLK